MKKIISFGMVVILIIFVFYSEVFADVVTTRKLNSEGAKSLYTKHNVNNSESNAIAVDGSSKQASFEKKLLSCVPYQENKRFDVGGVNFLFKVQIYGWINDKCRLDFESKTDGISPSFKSRYGFEASEASEIKAFAPKVRCEFTKSQLTEFGDLLLQENERSAGVVNNMLKDPSEISIVSKPELSQVDQKLFDMLMNTSTCQMLGLEDLNNVINSIFGY